MASHSDPIKNENNTTDIGVIGKIINNSPFSNKKSDSSTPPIYIDYFVKHKLNVSGIKFSNYSKFNYDKYKSNNKKTINIQKNDYIYNNPTLQNDIFNCYISHRVDHKYFTIN